MELNFWYMRNNGTHPYEFKVAMHAKRLLKRNERKLEPKKLGRFVAYRSGS